MLRVIITIGIMNDDKYVNEIIYSYLSPADVGKIHQNVLLFKYQNTYN